MRPEVARNLRSAALGRPAGRYEARCLALSWLQVSTGGPAPAPAAAPAAAAPPAPAPAAVLPAPTGLPAAMGLPLGVAPPLPTCLSQLAEELSPADSLGAGRLPPLIEQAQRLAEKRVSARGVSATELKLSFGCGKQLCLGACIGQLAESRHPCEVSPGRSLPSPSRMCRRSSCAPRRSLCAERPPPAAQAQRAVFGAA